MPAKPHTPTQHASMKLLAIVATLICANGVAANSTSEPMAHRRLGGSLQRSIAAEMSEWVNTFRHQEQEKRRNSVSGTLLDLTEFQTNLYLKYNGWIPIEQRTIEALTVLENNNLIDVVKVINAGKLKDPPVTRMLANQMELQLLHQWHTNGKSLVDLFNELKLNEMRTEMELYTNPAFTTWTKFAFYRIDPELLLPAVYVLYEEAQKNAFRSMLAVLKETMADKREFEVLLNVDADTKQEKKLFGKWYYVFKQHSLWHEIVFGE